MAIKETPINIKIYYHLMVKRASEKIETLEEEKEKIKLQCKELHEDIAKSKDLYKNNFKINLDDYEEFVNEKHIEGKFLKVAKGLFINRNNNYELVADLFNLYNYASLLKKLFDIEKDITFNKKLKSLTCKEYTNILRIFYTEVHKKLIIEGDAYSFGLHIGWIGINRIVRKSHKPILDYAATKKREAELKAQGKRIWNKEEAEWCKKNGIEYKAEDKRVFKHDEYYYEIPLINSKLPNASLLKLEISDYRHTSARGKTNDQLIEECNFDINKICELPIDLKTKLTLCDKANKILYTKFIRYENQKSVVVGTAYSKNR